MKFETIYFTHNELRLLYHLLDEKIRFFEEFIESGVDVPMVYDVMRDLRCDIESHIHMYEEAERKAMLKEKENSGGC